MKWMPKIVVNLIVIQFPVSYSFWWFVSILIMEAWIQQIARPFCSNLIYMNRVLAIRCHKMFQETEFKTLHEEYDKWNKLPISRGALHSDFKKSADEELCNRTSHVLLQV